MPTNKPKAFLRTVGLSQEDFLHLHKYKRGTSPIMFCAVHCNALLGYQLQRENRNAGTYKLTMRDTLIRGQFQ